MAEKSGENMIIFRKPEEEWGEFSNQYPAPFTYMGIRFESVEQFLYYMRAVFGRSQATAEKILACGADSAALSKASKKQRILENNTWEAVRPQIMRRGMRQKFLQNPELRKKLLSTGFRLLVEVSKEGLIGRLLAGNEEWGNDPGKWKGRNVTGKTLMQVRADLRCADRLVGPDDTYVFPEETFILKTPVGQMTLQEIAMLPGARDSVRAYAETAQQYLQLFLASADDFIGRYKISLVSMERAIARNKADVEQAISRAKAAAEAAKQADQSDQVEQAQTDAAEPALETPAGQEEEFRSDPAGLEPAGFTEAVPEAAAGETAVDAGIIQSLNTDTSGEDLPDDIPAEGFYELLYDLDELMKLGRI